MILFLRHEKSSSEKKLFRNKISQIMCACSVRKNGIMCACNVRDFLYTVRDRIFHFIYVSKSAPLHIIICVQILNSCAERTFRTSNFDHWLGIEIGLGLRLGLELELELVLVLG